MKRLQDSAGLEPSQSALRTTVSLGTQFWLHRDWHVAFMNGRGGVVVPWDGISRAAPPVIAVRHKQGSYRQLEFMLP